MEKIASRFARQSTQMADLSGRLKVRMDKLRQDGWQGRGATAFLSEMDGKVLPALQRLADALNQAEVATNQVSQVLRTAETEAAALFRSHAEGEKADQGGDGSSHLVNEDAAPDLSEAIPPTNPKIDGVTGMDGVTYGPVQGQPTIDGVHPDDVEQGQLGDCYLLASLASIANQNPDMIEKMIRDNGDGSYTVTFYEKGWFGSIKPVEVTVDGQFPLRDGRPVFAGVGDKDGDHHELWTMIVEKAYAQWKGGYSSIEGGWPHHAMEHLTGIPSQDFAPTRVSIEQLSNFHHQGYAISLSTNQDWKLTIAGRTLWDFDDITDGPLFQKGGGQLVPSHAYYVTGVDAENGTVTIRNPWGWYHGEITLTTEEFQQAFSTVSVNPIVEENRGK
jgi:WXG100 family type VII secretion target